jgi:hypothetical protein
LLERAAARDDADSKGNLIAVQLDSFLRETQLARIRHNVPPTFSDGYLRRATCLARDLYCKTMRMSIRFARNPAKLTKSHQAMYRGHA